MKWQPIDNKQQQTTTTIDPLQNHKRMDNKKQLTTSHRIELNNSRKKQETIKS